MLRFSTTILQFDQQGEKTGWTYIAISATQAAILKPGNKKSFRVKGKLDAYPIKQVALMPMGNGEFIMPLNAKIRKGIKKRKGAILIVEIVSDESVIPPPPGFIYCLKDEPKGLDYYYSLSPSHQLYFTKWIETAKTELTRTKRIAQAINALSRQLDFGSMLRLRKREKNEL